MNVSSLQAYAVAQFPQYLGVLCPQASVTVGRAVEDEHIVVLGAMAVELLQLVHGLEAVILGVVEPALADADGRLPGQIIVVTVVGEHLGVVVAGQVRVTKPEVAWEVAEGVTGLLLLGHHVHVELIGRTDGPVDADLTVGLPLLDDLVDVRYGPAIVLRRRTRTLRYGYTCV